MKILIPLLSLCNIKYISIKSYSQQLLSTSEAHWLTCCNCLFNLYITKENDGSYVTNYFLARDSCRGNQWRVQEETVWQWALDLLVGGFWYLCTEPGYTTCWWCLSICFQSQIRLFLFIHICLLWVFTALKISHRLVNLYSQHSFQNILWAGQWYKSSSSG